MNTITALAHREGDHDWLSTRDAARLLEVPPRTLYRLIDDGRIPAYKFGRVLRLLRHEVLDFARHNGLDPDR